MFAIEQSIADAVLRDGDETNVLISEIANRGYHPSIRSMVKAAFSSANQDVGADYLEQVVARRRYVRRRRNEIPGVGDIFFTDDEVFIIHPTSSKLITYSIRRHDIESSHQAFCDTVKEAANAELDGRRLRGMNFDWERVTIDSSDEEEGILRSRPAEYSSEEAEQSGIVVNQANREFLVRLAQLRGKARSVDAFADTDDSVIENLVETGLVDQEYIVLCRQDSHTLFSLKEREQIENMGDDMKCTECGRPIQDEVVQDMFTLTEGGRDLLKGSHWMTVWITELLSEAGLPVDKVRWNAESGGAK